MKKIFTSSPYYDGYYMPAEFEKHYGTIIVWPERPGSWIYKAKNARVTFAKIISAIAESEKVFVIVSDASIESAKELLKTELQNNCVQLVNIKTDDAWARDIAPTFVKNENSLKAINWKFNAWGGEYDGLYDDYLNDDAFANNFCSKNNIEIYNASPFVCEGGSIHSNGQGLFIVTEACLLSPGRNPSLSKTEIEYTLKNYVGARKIIWLPHGIYGDETNEHIDNMCAFTSPTEVVLAWTEDKNDPQYEYCKSAYEILSNSTDLNGNKIFVRKLPLPKKPVCITEYEAKGFEYEIGETQRTVGEKLAASYVNFYITNNAVILPQFGDENDELAKNILSLVFPTRKIVPIFARDIIVGGGNIHCITQQIPFGDFE